MFMIPYTVHHFVEGVVIDATFGMTIIGPDPGITPVYLLDSTEIK